MKISRKILAAPFITTLLAGQVCFAATVSPPPTFMISPTAFPVTTVEPTAATEPALATTPPPTSTTTTDPNGTVTAEPTPPPSTPTETVDPSGTTVTATPPATTTGTNSTSTATDPTVPPRETTTPPATTNPPPPRTNNFPTEEPVIGILDVPLETNTQEQCEASLTPICPAPEQIAKTLTPILTENQLKMALLVFFGGGLGALLWVFSANIMNGSQMKREEVRFDRQQRASNENRRLDQLSKTYGRLSGTIASLYKESGSKLTLTKDALKNYLSSSIELEMYGSEESLNAHKQFLGMLTNGNSVTKEAFEKNKDNLIGALKKDLGLSK